MPTGVYPRVKPINRKYPDDAKMKNPRIPRELDKRYKLMEEDIKEIRDMYKGGGHTHQSLADIFGVSTSTICYYVNDDFRRYQMEKNAKHIHPNKEKYREYIKRKKSILEKEFKLYNAIRARKLRQKNRVNN